MTTCLQLCVHF